MSEPASSGKGRATRLHFSRQEELFKEFIVAASKAYGEALVSNEPQLQEIIALYAMVSRMRVLCRPQTVARADQIMLTTIEKYFEPNRTIRELPELTKNGVEMDPLKEFTEAAREELEAFLGPSAAPRGVTRM